MRPRRWWSVILTLGLCMALSPLSSQAGPNRAFAGQPNRQAFTSPQPRAHTNGWNRQPYQRQQMRGQTCGWNGHNRQWQHQRAHTNGWNRQPYQRQQVRGQTHGWNGHNRQWQHQRAQTNRWNSQPHRWNQPRGNAYGWNGQNRQWNQPRRNAYGWNGNQRPGVQHRNAYGRNDRQYQWQQPPTGGQQNNTGSSYNRAGRQGYPQSANITPSSSGYSRDTTISAGETGARPSSRNPDASGSAPLSQDRSRSGVI